jgi:hypothetical protein
VISVLILAYDFPPYVSVGGLRPHSWFSYLKEYGVEPIVVTRQWGNANGNHLDFVAPGWSKAVVIETLPQGTIIRTPYAPNLSNRLLLRYGERRFRGIRKVISGCLDVLQFFGDVGPKKELYKAAKAYLAQHNVDLILATGEPFVLFHYARKLSETYHIPWIADYRDPWTPNLKGSQGLLKPFYSLLEKKIVSKALLVTTVSSYFENQIRKQVPTGVFSIIPNGFDESSLEQIKGIKQASDVLRIGFVGTLYEWHPLTIVLETLNRWATKFPDRKIAIHFHGTNKNEEIRTLVKNRYPRLTEWVFTHPKVPNDIMLQRLASYNALLLFNYYAFMGTKIYDYLAIKRKVIFCFTDEPEALVLKKRYYPFDSEGTLDNVQETLLTETNAGVLVRNAEDLMQTFAYLYDEHKDTGEIRCLSKGVESFSRRIQVERLAIELKKLC